MVKHAFPRNPLSATMCINSDEGINTFPHPQKMLIGPLCSKHSQDCFRVENMNTPLWLTVIWRQKHPKKGDVRSRNWEKMWIWQPHQFSSQYNLSSIDEWILNHCQFRFRGTRRIKDVILKCIWCMYLYSWLNYIWCVYLSPDYWEMKVGSKKFKVSVGYIVRLSKKQTK